MIDLSVKIKLEDLVEGMEFSTLEGASLLHIPTGKFVFITNDFLQDAEDGEPYDDKPDWQQEQMIVAVDIVENRDDYLSLPSQFEIHEYEIIEAFCDAQKGNAQTELLNAIKGSGAFRRFREKIHHLGIVDDWYTFRDESFRQIAIRFCENYGLEYE